MSNFIKVTQSHGIVRWVNFDNVESFSSDGSGGTNIVFTDAETMRVKEETMDLLKQMGMTFTVKKREPVKFSESVTKGSR